MRALITTFVISVLSVSALAQDQDEVVRLPGQGELKLEAVDYVEDIGRLIPGGGLLLSFDTDKNKEITPEELESGIEAAFLLADRNKDGRMTPLEQIKWTQTLPSHDVSLANPARFDPNLDRVVRNEEFHDVIMILATQHMDEVTGIIHVSALKSTQQGRLPPEEVERAPNRRPVAEEEGASPQRTRQRSAGGGGGS